MLFNSIRQFLLILLQITCFVQLTSGQEFNLKSLNGQKDIVRLALNDHGILSAKCATNVFYIKNVNYIEKAKMLNKNFLLVAYGFRAGTGITAVKTMILSVSDHKIQQSMHIYSSIKEDFIDFSRPIKGPIKVDVSSIYEVGLSLAGSGIKDYKLIAKILDSRKSLHEPKTNYNSSTIKTLNFDGRKNLFYSSNESLSQEFSIFDPKQGTDNKQTITGAFPAVKLRNHSYCYINGEWYIRSGSKGLTKFSYR